MTMTRRVPWLARPPRKTRCRWDRGRAPWSVSAQGHRRGVGALQGGDPTEEAHTQHLNHYYCC